MSLRVCMLLAFVLVAAPARADVAPGPPPVEPRPEPPAPPPPSPGQCKTSVVERPGEQCANCTASASDPDRCQRELGNQGYEPRCREDVSGESAEVWCRGSSHPPPEEPRSCGACAVGRGNAEIPGGALLFGVALGFLRWRRVGRAKFSRGPI